MEVVSIVQDYADWLTETELPKLFINANPGAILIGEQREYCRGWKNQTEVTVVGSHFIQEDSPNEIGAALADWYGSLLCSRALAVSAVVRTAVAARLGIR